MSEESPVAVPMAVVEAIALRVARALATADTVRPITLSREDAASALGVSLSHFERHIQNDLSLVYSGRLRLVPVAELERWVLENAVRCG